MTRVEHGPNVTVELLSKQTGAPLPGAVVTVTPRVYTDAEMTNQVSTVTSGGDGAIRFYAPPGTYTFTTTAPAVLEPVEVLGVETGVGVIDGGAP